MNLPDLSSDILGQLSDIPDCSVVIIALWKCGDSKLNAKLASSVTSMHLRHRIGSYANFPSMLSQLRELRHFSVYSTQNVIGIPIYWPLELRKLPPTIESLELNLANGLSVFQDFGPRNEDNPLDTGLFTKTDIVKLFPRLTTLKVSNTVVPGEGFATKDFPPLPSTLTHLSLPAIRFQGSFTEKLPRSLEILDSTLLLPTAPFNHSALVKDWANVPTELAHIAKVSVGEELKWLPPKVTIGTLSLKNWNRAAAQVAASRVQRLSLEQVDTKSFGSKNTEWVEALPQGLLALTFGSDFVVKLGANLAGLPNSLTRISSLAPLVIDWSTTLPKPLATETRAAVNDFWPPGLVSMDFPNHKLAVSHIEALPRTLTSLNIHLVGSKLDKSGAAALAIEGNHFPPGLTHLSTKVTHYSKKMRFLSKLPRTLLTLELRANDPAISFDKESLENSLPKALTKLDLGNSDAFSMESSPDECTFALPPQLTSLSVWRMNSKNSFESLPRTLQTLSIHFLSSEPAQGDEDIFSGLPPHLNQLNVWKSASPDLNKIHSASSFSSLHQLSSLAIRMHTFPSSVLHSFTETKRLKSLEIALESLDPSDLLLLPKSLIALRLGPKVNEDDYKVHKSGACPPGLEGRLAFE